MEFKGMYIETLVFDRVDDTYAMVSILYRKPNSNMSITVKNCKITYEQVKELEQQYYQRRQAIEKVKQETTLDLSVGM